jgi:hypothetical protein
MPGLPLRVGFGRQRPAQPITRCHQVKQTLTLPDAQPEAKTLLDAGGEAAPIPEIELQSGGGRRLAHQGMDSFQLLGRESGGAAGMVALRQPRQTLLIESPHPVGHGAR